MAEGCTIRVNRRWQTEVSTISDFFIEGTPVKGFVLEEKGPSSTIKNLERRIPAGTYGLDWYPSGKFKGLMPRLSNAQVSRDRLILIHIGNNPKDTEGCLLVGASRGVNQIGGSTHVFTQVMKILRNSDMQSSQVIITEDFQ